MLRHALQHHLNALHILGRLVGLGCPRAAALSIARQWERLVHPLLYPSMRRLEPVRVQALPRLHPGLRRW
jgi:hypothetical protein